MLLRLKAACSDAKVEYEVIGGFAVYLHVDRIDPMEARLTRDIDINIRRQDVEVLASVAERHGFAFRHAAGIDMLVDPNAPRARSAVHMFISGTKIRPHYLSSVPEPAPVILDGFSVAPVDHLVQMKLTSFRPKDITHVQDMLAVGLITPEIEEGLSPELRARLEDVKKMER